MYTLVNFITGITAGAFRSYDSADNFRLSLDDFYLWFIDLNDYA